MNVPHLRETKEEFHKFIFRHKNGNFENGPSDQGAYNDFYADRTFLHRKFNMKPYWEDEDNWRDRYIIHFHGMKPMDILDLWLFGNDCNESIKFLCDKEAEYKFLCPSMQSFAIAATLNDATLDEFCGVHFLGESNVDGVSGVTVCKDYLKDLAGMSPLSVGSSCKPSDLEALALVDESRPDLINGDVTSVSNLNDNLDSILPLSNIDVNPSEKIHEASFKLNHNVVHGDTVADYEVEVVNSDVEKISTLALIQLP